MVTYPKDWNSFTLGDLGSIKMCRRIFSYQTEKSGQIPFYKIGTFGKKADAYISRDLYERYKSLYPYPKKGDILISAAGTIGRTVTFDGKDAYFQDSNIVWLDTSDEEVDSAFLKYFYESYPWTNLEGTTIRRLYNSLILGTSISLPSLPEQESIAETLSCIDTYITNLTELIEKKKGIRDGALEDLVSGRTRLEGFNGKWEKERLGKIANVQDGTHGTFARTNEGHLLLSAKNVFNNKLVLSENESRVSDSDYRIITANGYPQYGDILISCVGTIGRCCVYKNIGAAFQRSVAFIRTTINNQYLMYVLQCEESQKQLASMVNASAQGGIYLGSLRKLELLIADDAEEQEAIASVLSCMDTELASLEEEKDKMLQIKSGAMDDLLTGRVRLMRQGG